MVPSLNRKKRRHPSLIADGKETLSDSFVELAVLIGLIGSFIGLLYLDYIFGIIVTVIILRTSTEILKESGSNLLQRSISEEELKKLKEILKNTKGIEGHETKDEDRIMAFKIGKFIFVSIKIYISPTLTSEGLYYLRKGITQKIRECLSDSEVRVYIKETVLRERPSRAIIPVSEDKKDILNSFIEENLTKAKHFFIVDLMGDRIVTVSVKENKFKTKQELAEFIKTKRVNTVYSVKKDKNLEDLLKGVKFKETKFLIFKNLFH